MKWSFRLFPGLALAATAALARPSPATAQAPPGGTCGACHAVLDARLADPVAGFAKDVHAANGLGCVACHGGDATAAGPEAMDPARGFVGRPSRETIPALCGRCHSDPQFMKQYNPSLRVDQQAEYATSVHGERLARLGDPRVATCVSCHSAHGIRPPTDPQSSVHPLNLAATCGACHANAERMATYGIPTDQQAKYQQSVHWEALSVGHDLSAPTCNDCHGNHGAAPPGVSWVGNTCGQCHAVMAEHFARSRHGEVFPLIGMPGCAACHENHDIRAASDTMLGSGEGAVCSKCHPGDSEGGLRAEAMRHVIDTLRSEIDSARGLLQFAADAGVEVSQAVVDLEGAHSALVSTRAAVHTFDLDAVTREAATGRAITQEALARGRRALSELRFRRAGLAASALIILTLIVALLLRIRAIEGPARGATPE